MTITRQTLEEVGYDGKVLPGRSSQVTAIATASMNMNARTPAATRVSAFTLEISPPRWTIHSQR